MKTFFKKEPEKYPVLFFIHGGIRDLQEGNAVDFTEDAVIGNFVSKGIVVVVIQYRLSISGEQFQKL